MGLSIKDLCCLFCCPPCPSSIATKMAFNPPEPTYSFIPDDAYSPTKHTLHLTQKAEWIYTDKEKEVIEVFYTRSKRSNKIACMFVRCSTNARYCILFTHGNGTDLGPMSSFYYSLGTRINCNVFSYEYSGFGASSGKPSEKNLYLDIDAAYNALIERYEIPRKNIILYGQGIGTAATIDLASKHQVGAVILQSPLMSGCRVVFNPKRTWFFDPFPSIEKVAKIKSPVLVIHGTNDIVVDFSHGLEIHKRCPNALEPLWVEGAGHNDIELHSAYVERLKKLVDVELPSIQ